VVRAFFDFSHAGYHPRKDSVDINTYINPLTHTSSGSFWITLTSYVVIQRPRKSSNIDLIVSSRRDRNLRDILVHSVDHCSHVGHPQKFWKNEIEGFCFLLKDQINFINDNSGSALPQVDDRYCIRLFFYSKIERVRFRGK